MNPVDEQAVLNDFVKYLGERGLSVCNYSRNGAGFWRARCREYMRKKYWETKDSQLNIVSALNS